MNTLRLYAFLSCFALLIQPSVAQAPPTDPPPLDVTALCAESDALCVLTQRVQQLENQAIVEPTCYYLGVYKGWWCTGDPPPPDCPGGTIESGSDCTPIVVKPSYADRSIAIDTGELLYHWPVWWPRPWEIPRPPYPYPWRFGPLPDPWEELALQQSLGIAVPSTTNMATPGTRQLAMPVLVGTDKGTEPIPDFCLRAEWAEGQIPPECSSGLAGLVRKLGLSPEDAPLLQAAP